MRLIMIILYLLLILVGLSFAVLNAAEVPINLYLTQLTLPISVLILFSSAIGLIVGFFLFLYRYCSLKIKYLKLKNQLKLAEKNIVS